MPEFAGTTSISMEQDAAIERALARKKAQKPTAKHGKLPDPKKFGPNALDKNSFLKILVTQLQKQDPTNPMNDREFISQMAQFSSLEQMNNVASSMNKLRASQAPLFIGKMVTGKDIETDKPVQGIAIATRFQADGEVLLQIGSAYSKLDDIREVTNVTPMEAPVPMPAGNVSRETLPPGGAGASIRPAAGRVDQGSYRDQAGHSATAGAKQAAQAYEANQKATSAPPSAGAPTPVAAPKAAATPAAAPDRSLSAVEAPTKPTVQKINVPKGE